MDQKEKSEINVIGLKIKGSSIVVITLGLILTTFWIMNFVKLARLATSFDQLHINNEIILRSLGVYFTILTPFIELAI